MLRRSVCLSVIHHSETTMENNDQAATKNCCQSIVAFFAVLSTAFFIFVVPILCIVTLITLAILSFWPIIAISLPFLFLSFTVASILFCLIIAIVWRFYWKEATSFVGSRAFFLLPFHALFIAMVVSICSFWWSIALGAALFVQGEVDFKTQTVNSRWDVCVNKFDRWSWPVFQYFPITVSRDREEIQSKQNSKSKSKSKRTHIETKIDSSNHKYLFCYHPHGMYAIGLFSLVFQRASGFKSLFPKRKGGMLVGVASALLHVPILGKVVSWFGFIPASRESLDIACESDRDVALVPGGIAEMCLVQSNQIEQLYLEKRRGFVKLAIKHGRSLVPVYCFGENHIFQQFNFVNSTRQWLSRQLKVSIVFFRGRNCTLVPRQVPLNVVIGTPIHVIQSDSPSEEYIDRIHRKYLDDLEDLFDRNKKNHVLYRDTKLKFV